MLELHLSSYKRGRGNKITIQWNLKKKNLNNLVLLHQELQSISIYYLYLYIYPSIYSSYIQDKSLHFLLSFNCQEIYAFPGKWNQDFHSKHRSNERALSGCLTQNTIFFFDWEVSERRISLGFSIILLKGGK